MGKKSKNKDKTERKVQEQRANARSESRATSIPSNNNGTPWVLAPVPTTHTGTTTDPRLPLIQALQCGTGCTHGAKAADLGSIAYISTLCEELGCDQPESCYLKMRDAMKRDGWNDVPTDTIKAMFAIGTNLLLSRQETWVPIAGMIAMVMVGLRNGSLSDLEASWYAVHNFNYTVDSPKKLVAFYNKGITCHCLDELKAYWKADITKGMCANCSELFPDNQIYDCGQCRLAKYCSKICQREHWPEHKLCCNVCHQMKKNQQTTTP